jgi:hypothetical protein
LDEALRELESRWGTFAAIDRETQVAAHRWVIDHKDDFAPRKPKA